MKKRGQSRNRQETPHGGDSLWRCAASGGFLNCQPLHYPKTMKDILDCPLFYPFHTQWFFLTVPFFIIIIKSFGKVQETLSRKGFLVVEDKLGGGFWSGEPIDKTC